MPFASPDTTYDVALAPIEFDAVVHGPAPPTAHAVTLAVHDSRTYDVMSNPPFEVGADHVTRTLASWLAAVTFVGALAVVNGREVSPVYEPVPAPFTAATW